MTKENLLKAAVSVSAHCRQLNMSRSQFYWHVKRGTFHEPLRLSNGRPYFTASMVEDNLKAREMGVGVNGEYVLFYERQATSATPATDSAKTNHEWLMDGLKSLGLGAITTERLESALASCFPKGTTGQDETAVLRVVFRHLKRTEKD